MVDTILHCACTREQFILTLIIYCFFGYFANAVSTLRQNVLNHCFSKEESFYGRHDFALCLYT